MSTQQQILRFGVIGIAATLVHYSTALVLNEGMEISPFWSNFSAFLTAWPVSYFGNFFWTFETGTKHHKSMPRFGITAVSGLFLSQLIVWIGTGVMAYSLRWALVPALIIVPGMSFIVSRYWVFPENKSTPVQ